MKKLIIIILIAILVGCTTTRVIIDHGSTRHDFYFIDYEITKLENNDIEVKTMLRRLNKYMMTYCDTIETEEYKQKLSELYRKALTKLNEDLKDE